MNRIVPIELPGETGLFSVSPDASDSTPRPSIIRAKTNVLPHDEGEERALLGFALLTPEALGRAFDIAPPSMFFDRVRQRIATAIASILGHNEQPNVITVLRWLKDNAANDLPTQSELYELHEIGAAPYIGNPELHAKVIRELFIRRERILIDGRRVEQFREGKRSIHEIDKEADERIAAIVGNELETPNAPQSGPLAGLARLGKLALVGYEALVTATSEPIQWVWEGVCTAAHATEITGPSGEGKTTLAVLLICGLANPTDTPSVLLGRTIQPLLPGRYVLLIEQENGVHSMRRKLEASCSALCLPVRETIDRVIAIVRKNVRSGDETWGEIRTLAQRGFIGATFIDSRARVLRSGESNSEEDQAAIADEITALIELSRGPAFVISHTKKGADLDGIESISGSAQRGAGTDNAISVKANRDANGRVTSVVARFIKLRDCEGDEYPEPVTMAMLKAEDGSYYLTESGIEERTEQPLEARIEAELSSGPKTKSALRAALKRSAKDIELGISNLFAAKRIRSCDVRVNNRVEKGFMLPPEQRSFGGNS